MFTALELSDMEPPSKWDWIAFAMFIVSMIAIAVLENY